jgi:putative membrane protein
MYTWVIVFGVIALGIILYARKNRNNILKKESPLDILNRRFANGEISKEEYQKSKKNINSKK